MFTCCPPLFFNILGSKRSFGDYDAAADLFFDNLNEMCNPRDGARKLVGLYWLVLAAEVKKYADYGYARVVVWGPL